MHFRIHSSYAQVAEMLGRSVFKLDIAGDIVGPPPQRLNGCFQIDARGRPQDYPQDANSIVRRQWRERGSDAVQVIQKARDEWLPFDNYLRGCLATMRRDHILEAAKLIESTLAINPERLLTTAGATNIYLSLMTSEQRTIVLAIIIVNAKYQRPDDESAQEMISKLLGQWQLHLKPSQYELLQAMQKSRGTTWFYRPS